MAWADGSRSLHSRGLAGSTLGSRFALETFVAETGRADLNHAKTVPLAHDVRCAGCGFSHSNPAGYPRQSLANLRSIE